MRRKDVHLEKHAAGRLLEDAGDRIRREMTVRSLRAADRTRLIDRLLAPGLQSGLRRFSGGRFAFVGSVALVCGCTAASRPATNPSPEAPAPPRISESGTWTVPAWRGKATYRVSRSVRIEGATPVPRAERYASEAAEKLEMTSASGGVNVSLAFDSADASLGVSARVAAGTLSIADDSTAIGAACDVRAGALKADLADLAVTYPNALAVGMQWADSLENTTCISGFPGRVSFHRRFRVEIDTAVAGGHAVIISRRDSISATAEGLIDRHQTSVGAEGNALSRIYLNIDSGQPLIVNKTLVLTILVKTASRTGSFVERAASVFQLR